MASVDEISVQIAAINRASSELRRVAADITKLDQAAGRTSGLNRFNSQVSAFGKFSAGFTRDAKSIALGIVGAQAAIGGLTGSIKGTVGAAISFESSFAGIRKTVDATEEEFGQLAAANREMAREIPVTADGINRIGELAGQLGVTGVGNIAKFERVIADLANTTNLSAEAAATSFAQIANVLQLPIADIDRFGSAVVDLGNKSAATEADITAFSQRISGAGKIAGLSAAEVAGVGAAFASVGVEAEAGGTAIQKVLIEMTKAAAEGGDQLEVFAEVTGLTVKQFQDLAKSNPAEAFTQFVEGLGKAGDKAFGILEDLELGDQRLIRSFLSAAGAGDLLRRSIETGSQAFEENTALTIEAEKRYGTTAAQLQILKNNVTDVGISIGNELLPAINESVAAAGDLLEAVKPLGPGLKLIATAAPAAAAGLVIIAAASKAVSFAQLQGDIAILTKAGFPNLARQAAGTTGIMSSLGAAVRSPLGAFAALTVGLIALDFAIKKISGEGLIDTLTGAKEKAESAARQQALYNDQLERLNALIVAMGDPKGRIIFAEQSVQSIVDMTASLKEANEALADKRGAGGFAEAFKGLEGADKIREEIDAMRKAVDSAGLSHVQLERIVRGSADAEAALSDQVRKSRAAHADLVPELADSSREQREFQRVVRETTAAIDTQSTTFDFLAKAAGGAAQAYDALDASIKAVTDVLSRPDLADRVLTQQIAELDAQIAAYEALGDAISAEQQVELDAFTAMRDQLGLNQSASQAMTEAVAANFATLATKVQEETGKSSTAITELGGVLGGLPEQLAIEIITTLNRVAADEAERIAKRLTQLAVAGISIPVAFDLIGEQKLQQSLPRRQGHQGLDDGFAQGGIVKKHSFIEVGEGNKPELILPLTKPDRVSQLLNKAGLLAGSFADGGSTDPFLDLARGNAPRGGASHAAGDSGISKTANDFADLAAAINASGKSATQFIAEMELYDEQQAAVAEATRITAESADRAQIDLTKLAITLGKAGITGEAFIAQQGLLSLADAFRQSGMGLEEFRNSIQGFTADLLEQAGRASKRTGGKAINTISTGEGFVKDGSRSTVSGNVTDEGLQKIIDRTPGLRDHLREHPEDVRRTDAPVPGIRGLPPTVQNFNGPVTVNTQGGVDQTLRELTLGGR